MADSPMVIEGREFTLVGSIRAVRRPDGSICVREPQTLYKKKVATSKLHAYGHGTFCKFDVDDAPNATGVYFMVLRGEIQYVGETVNLRDRFKYGYGNISPRNCFINGQETNCRINKLILEVLRCGDQVEVWFCRCKDRKELEEQLKASLAPPWNLEGKR